MDYKQVKYELQNLISGKSGASYDALIQTVAGYLRSGTRASPMAASKHQNKAEERKKLVAFAEEHQLFVNDINEDNFVSEGAEQKVYIKDGNSVIKLNDSIYYASWEDYFHNLLLHNYFFSDTAYRLLGFNVLRNSFYSVVEQPFVKSDSLTDIRNVHCFMEANGFVRKNMNDYYHPYLGLILEDLHDENVLTSNEMLYFIDTVFYIDPIVFWEFPENA